MQRPSSRVMILLLCAVAVASTASLLAGLRHRFARQPKDSVRESSHDTLHESDATQTTAIAGDLLTHRRATRDLPADRRAYLRALPRLDPPLSQTVREDRDARG